EGDAEVGDLAAFGDLAGRSEGGVGPRLGGKRCVKCKRPSPGLGEQRLDARRAAGGSGFARKEDDWSLASELRAKRRVDAFQRQPFRGFLEEIERLLWTEVDLADLGFIAEARR